MKELRVSFPFTGRVFDNGVTPKNTKAIWFVFHGYGQLAFYFLKKFEILSTLGIRVIAPEGLSRYYLKESSGRVGASWMTKEDRLTDISNYLSFLSTAYHKIKDEYELMPPVCALGFSQGAATVCRWAVSSNIPLSHLVLWAGLLPPDLELEKGQNYFNDKQVHFVYGEKDPYLNDNRFIEMDSLSSKLNINPKKWTFQGVHELDNTLLQQIADYTLRIT